MRIRRLVKRVIGRRLTAAATALVYRPQPAPVDDPEERERLARAASSCDVVRLHVGCGPRVLKGWLNIDLAYEPFEAYLRYYGDRFYPPEVRGARSEFFAIDPTHGLPLPDDSVAVIFHEDFIEHLSQRDALVFLAETYRVLRCDGVHRVNTPNLITSMRRSSDFTLGAAGVHVGEWDRHGHLNVLSPSSLEEFARLVGYQRIEFGKRDQTLADDLPPEYRPDPADRGEDGNIFADLIKRP